MGFYPIGIFKVTFNNMNNCIYINIHNHNTSVVGLKLSAVSLVGVIASGLIPRGLGVPGVGVPSADPRVWPE